MNDALVQRIEQLSLELPAELTVWKVDISGEFNNPALAACLSHEEQTRANRFKRSHLRTRYMLTRAALRTQLGARLGIAPANIPIATTDNGRPFTPDHTVDFNVSHSADRALIAIASNSYSVGVDIEFIRPTRDLTGMARTVFTPAEQQLLADNPHREADIFYQLWTCKEAYLKALGTGLQLDMQRIEIDASQPNQSRHLIVPGPDPLLTLSFTPEPNHQAALTLLPAPT